MEGAPSPGDDPLAPWDYALPDELIARFPPAERDAGRLLVVGPPLRDLAIRDLPSLLRPGDLLVVNDVRVHRARLRARRATGGEVEVLLVGRDEALVRPARRLKVGEVLPCGPGAVHLEARIGDGRWRVRCDPDPDTLAEAVGEVPLPPYLGRAPVPDDVERYQTVYARHGDLRAAAAPTAGLHFTPSLLAALDAAGVARASVTLEVGLGTFKPLAPEQLAAGQLHAERFVVPEATWAAIARARRVVAVGTTVARALESATGPGPGETTLFIREGYRFRRVGALFTNLHLPRSSLLMLVCAFGGRARVLDAYAHAVAARYRFFSYGDAMFVEPDNF
ncbi:MAG: tRNA preQ1(34) S-adenosylmethionine ribosyltransferase-isomerase QueA [Myxococcota bacterium]